MKIFTYPFALIFFLTIITGSSIFAQSDEIATTAAGKKVILRPDKTWEFVIEKPAVEMAQGKFEGDDLVQVTDFVDSLQGQLAKSEFETEGAFIARIHQVLKATKNPASGRNLDDTIFVFDGLDRYDAETQTFKVSPFSIRLLGDIGKPAKGSGKYSTYQIELVERDKSYAWQRHFSDKTLNFSMKPEMAKLIKPNLRLAVYGLPVSVQVGSLSLVPTKYVAFNILTGEIYAEVKEDDLMISK